MQHDGIALLSSIAALAQSVERRFRKAQGQGSSP